MRHSHENAASCLSLSSLSVQTDVATCAAYRNYTSLKLFLQCFQEVFYFKDFLGNSNGIVWISTFFDVQTPDAHWKRSQFFVEGSTDVSRRDVHPVSRNVQGRCGWDQKRLVSMYSIYLPTSWQRSATPVQGWIGHCLLELKLKSDFISSRASFRIGKPIRRHCTHWPLTGQVIQLHQASFWRNKKFKKFTHYKVSTRTCDSKESYEP